MDRYDVHIRDSSVSEVLRETAEAHGRSVEEELSALIEKTYVPKVRKSNKAKKPSKDWVTELLELGQGLDLRIPESRSFVRYAPNYPEGMEPRDGESLIEHISRISRPGVDLEVERDRSPHEGPNL